ncbi:unnamed protein product [Cylindrotheca closterium]|uniref:Uncharacterized protein n=1 Tax=Cylindrotheca closterium TaxID=2856 RepID=A0AAD2FK09_9STRA|nr:unnamed protein product [Cylindrotheca closterium]
MSPEAQRQSRKAARGEGSGRSSNRTTAPPGNNDAVQRKLAAAGLANEEAGTKEKQSKSVELNTNEDGEVLLEAMAVEAMEEKPPVQREVDSGGATDAPSPQEPLPEQKKRPVGMIILVVLLLGACGGAGAYFGTRGTSEAAAVATDSTTPIPTSSINVTSSPSTIAPTAPPTKALNASVTEIRLADETPAPSDNPTDALSAQPSLAPSLIALEKPTSAPVIEDIVTITKEPTTLPSVTPTLTTSENPTVAPAIGPTTEEPTRLPSIMPSKAPSVAPTPLPTESPTTKAPTPEPSTMPSSRPTFELMEGDHLQNEHYVHYMPDDGSDAYPYNSREEAQDACETRGLTLCSQSAITNFPLCKIGWLTDERGLWSIGEGCGFGGFTDGGFFGVFGEGGAYCCGRPLYMPNDIPREQSYIYSTREEGLAACETKGLGLCSKEQITGYELCSYGWLTDDVGLWMSVGAPGCGPAGFSGTIFPNNGAYCCVEPAPTLAPSTVPTSTPSAIPTPLPTPPPTPPPTPLPSTMPSSRPTFELMEGDHLQNEHYVYYMPDDGSDAYPYNSREEAQDACETKGLTLCSQSAITNFPLCCGPAGFSGTIFPNNGAYCCAVPS